MKKQEFSGATAFIESLKDKRVFVAGIGISNMPLIHFLSEKGVKNITAADSGGRNPAAREAVLAKMQKLAGDGVIKDFVVGENYLDEAYKADYIFKSPGIRFDHPGLVKAVENGSVLTSEMEEFIRYCPAKIYGITGSDGKTTTTTLVKLLLEKANESTGVKVYVGGNIGEPLFSKIEQIRPQDLVVLELSSFQLLNMPLSTATAVVTNMSPNHLDMHKGMDEYIAAKQNIFLHGSKVTVLNEDNAITCGMKNLVKGELRTFSRKVKPENGAFMRRGKIYRVENGVEHFIMDRGTIRIPGNHNVENYLAAICAVGPAVSDDDIRYVASTFNGVEHRIELCAEKGGVRYFNSSIDSSPKRSAVTLRVFRDKNIIMIAGGKDKILRYDCIGAQVCDKVKTLILTGPTSAKIRTAVEKRIAARRAAGKDCNVEIIDATGFENAVETAISKAKSGDIVLLSPASTSFDRFANFEERGNLFKKIVRDAVNRLDN